MNLLKIETLNREIKIYINEVNREIKRKKWTKKEIEFIFYLRQKKKTYFKIGQLFNVTGNSIYKTFVRYNVNPKVKEGSFLWGLELFNLIHSKTPILFNKNNFYYYLNKEAYTKISILIILNKFLLKYGLAKVN